MEAKLHIRPYMNQGIEPHMELLRERIVVLSNCTPVACGCPTALQHWERVKGALPVYCTELNCLSRAEVGTLVEDADRPSAGWHIVPLCHEHSEKTGEVLTLMEGRHIVHVAEDCAHSHRSISLDERQHNPVPTSKAS
jgi:hypothetical protein